MRIDGTVAFVTGAGSGIGRQTALALARRGADVALADVRPDRLEPVAHEIKALGRGATCHTVDVADSDAFWRVRDEVVEAHGRCNIVVNNAGVTSAGAFGSESLEDLRWIVGINLWGVVHGCRAFLEVLDEHRPAHIVNLSSMVGLLGLPHNASYSLTKGAVRSFSEALRAELAPAGIGVTTVFPGAIRTDITNRARGSSAIKLKEMGGSRFAPLVMRRPEAVASAIVKGVERNRGRVVVGPDARVVAGLTRLVPGRSGPLGRLTAALERRG
ncbi:MAG: SDR family NAD(P)-dependent oxidoreductase [Microthrixaceae bacterium]